MSLPHWAAMAAMIEPDPEGGSIYPVDGMSNSMQMRQSAYYMRNYEPGDSSWLTFGSGLCEAWEMDERQNTAGVVVELLHYIMTRMEPTDRCLRPPGDIFDPKRLEAESGE